MLKKILVFSFSFIGDAVLSTAVIQPLRRHFSDAHITFLVGRRPRAFDLLATDANIDATLVYDNRGEHAGWKGRLRLIKTLRLEKFDLVVNLRDSLTARCIGAEHWGMARGDSNRHAVVRYLEVLQRHNVDTTDAHPYLQLTEAEHAAAHHFLVEAGLTSERKLIGIHPGGNWDYKLWDGKNYADVASILAEKHNAAILLFAGSGRATPPNRGCRDDGCSTDSRPNGRSSAACGVNLCMRCVYRKRYGADAYRSSRGNACRRAFRFNEPYSERSLR